LKDGERLIHELSKQHQGYDPADTKAKYDQAREYKEADDLGWPKCETIHGHGCTHCGTCPHLAVGKSPLNLAPRMQADSGVNLEDFYAYMPLHNYIFAPSRES
jgi:hypothetical protein